MEKETSGAVTVDEYISRCREEIQPMLRQMAAIIRDAAPEAAEKISWGMPTFVLYGNLVHFSAEQHHMGFHPAPSSIETFSGELIKYSCSKGTIRFPYGEPLPKDLIRRIVLFRVQEQKELEQKRSELKESGKKPPVSRRPRYEMPDDIKSALETELLRAAYDARPPYQRNDYIGWITRAKRPETREKRLCQMIKELRNGNVYMGSACPAGKAEHQA